jgi:GT2 family glycosyltransferase
VAAGNGPFGEAVALGTSSPFGVGGARFHYSDQEEWLDTVYMGAWRREIFNRVGLFDEELVRNQDDEFNYRLRAHGGRILLSPKIKSTYTVRGNPAALWKQYFQYGFWKVRVLQKHFQQMRPRQFVPPLFVAALLGSAVLAPFSVMGQSFLVIVAGFYLIANLAASVYTDRQYGWRHLLLLPFVFAILHFAYGSGFLMGLLKFFNRWGDKAGKVPAMPTVDARTG